MKKMPCLFMRNFDIQHSPVYDQVTLGCEWVLAGEGVATRKWDGTACLVRNGQLYRRYDAKHGKTPPATFEPAQSEPDPLTGHWPGWLPVGEEPESRWHREAFGEGLQWTDWTYELCGPKLQGNPESLSSHILIPHGQMAFLHDVPRTFAGLCDYLSRAPIEGIVFWRDLRDLDCDKVKIRRKDFGLPWPVPS